mmetsp:Transcript_32225/g.59091  ORF Transcript_32225/g.59091 Transcript_32225/m.59091 type:complete len:198 (-) Transcript_32225:907-1500(-)|eukprot:CAMPEP_0201604688 /NCGR_PEP_ID=MMETSP0492-20130828/4753_1 /ASSEMBLY_ACC=CAM_ASM_000837 /TAXON_ID=420259 /ORGANISM="Thalassiosira gravida, Strain GMp14c1" /LENGTH=197 /DNA_ID=CAMNT_0048068777 /DNA_START=200 /DNA_END=793 /DNA_ORIENTATION=-
MSVSIHSPLSSNVVSSFDSLSPPPTPIAKRSCHFFPSNAATPTIPMFFRTSQSLFSSSSPQCHFHTSSSDNEKATGKKQLASLASRPAPSLQLRVRSSSVSQSRVALKELQLDQIPALPFLFPDTSFRSIESSTPQKHSPSNSSTRSSDSVNILKSTSKKQKPIASPNQQAKLPAFHRSGMKHRAVKQRNSFVARSA